MPTNSFDIVSQINLQEVNNAVHQASKEIQTRYDLKSTHSSIELDETESKIVVKTPDDFTRRSVVEVLEQKLVRRQVPLKGLAHSEPQPAAGSSLVQEIGLQQGIPIEKAREIVKLIKNSKLKVQSSIQGDQVRVSGKKRDDLQSVMAIVKEKDFDIHLEFTNYRSN